MKKHLPLKQSRYTSRLYKPVILIETANSRIEEHAQEMHRVCDRHGGKTLNQADDHTKEQNKIPVTDSADTPCGKTIDE